MWYYLVVWALRLRGRGRWPVAGVPEGSVAGVPEEPVAGVPEELEPKGWSRRAGAGGWRLLGVW